VTATDTELVNRILAGSEEAFEELVRRYQRPVFALIVRIVRDPSRAEELAQDTFVKAFRRLETFDGHRKFSSWVLAIAHNTAIDEIRRSGGEASPLEEMGDDVRESRHFTDARDGPARMAERAELAQAIERAIGRLRPEYRELASLRYESDLGYEEIAEITALPVGTVKSYLHRARKELAESLSAAGWGTRVGDPR
jgi:RNA polymerase sigma-70 factor (ECF subfamily)